MAEEQRGWLRWSFEGLVRGLLAGCLFFLDQLLMRYLLVGLLVAPFALIAWLRYGVSLWPFVILVALVGTALAGFWENSEIASARRLSRALPEARE